MKTYINTFEEMYNASIDPDNLLSSFICGHIMIEFLMIKIVEIAHPDKNKYKKKLNHASLINLMEESNLLSNKQCTVLKKINLMRNEFAHHIGYKPTVSQLRNLFVISNECFDDVTDGFKQGIGELKEIDTLDVEGPFYVSELFMQISYNLHDIYQLHGGDSDNLTKKHI